MDELRCWTHESTPRVSFGILLSLLEGGGFRVLLGLDIGSTALRACALGVDDAQVCLTLFDVENLPQGAVVNGVIVQTAQVIDALRALLTRTIAEDIGVAVTLPHSATRVCVGTLTEDNGHYDIDAAMALIEPQIPDSWGEYHLSISPFHSEDPSRVLIVAAPKAAVLTMQHVVESAGATLVGIDAAPAVGYNLLAHQGLAHQATALVDIGLQESRVLLFHQGLLLSNGVFARGGQDLRESLQRTLNLHMDEAERYKIGGEADGVVPRDVHEQLRVSCETLAEGIWSTLQDLMQSAKLSSLDSIQCIGRGADLSVFYDALAARSGCTVGTPAPLRGLKANTFDYTESYLDAVRGASSFAFGTALPWIR